MTAARRRATFGPAVYYMDPLAALDWLEQAFGFTRSIVITDNKGELVHSQMEFEGGYVMIGSSWADYTATPAQVGGKNTQSIHVHLQTGLDEHCNRARAAGAAIVREPEDQFYGDRAYSARDPEGHVWNFGQTIRRVTREEAVAASGLNIDGWM